MTTEHLTDFELKMAWSMRINNRLYAIGRSGDTGQRLTPSQVDRATDEIIACLDDLEIFS